MPRRTVGQRQVRLSVDVIALQELPCPCAAAMPPPEPPPQCLAAGRGRLPAHREVGLDLFERLMDVRSYGLDERIAMIDRPVFQQ